MGVCVSVGVCGVGGYVASCFKYDLLVQYLITANNEGHSNVCM